MKRTESQILAMELVFRENYGREMNEQERKYFNLPPAPPLSIEQRLRRIRSRLEPHIKQRH